LNQNGSFYVSNPDSSEFYRHVNGTEWYKASPMHMRKKIKSEHQGSSAMMEFQGVVVKFENSKL